MEGSTDQDTLAPAQVSLDVRSSDSGRAADPPTEAAASRGPEQRGPAPHVVGSAAEGTVIATYVIVLAPDPPGQEVTLGQEQLGQEFVPGTERSDIVLGVPIEGSATVKLVRRVIVLAALAATFYICHFIAGLLRDIYTQKSNRDIASLWADLSTLFIELSVPACGYSGAVYYNKQLTCCFCSCNLFFVLLFLWSFAVLIKGIYDVDGECEWQTDPQERQTCLLWTSDTLDRYFVVGSTVTVICIQCSAFWFGKGLYKRLAQEADWPAPATPLVGEVVTLLPGRSEPAAIPTNPEPDVRPQE